MNTINWRIHLSLLLYLRKDGCRSVSSKVELESKHAKYGWLAS